MTDQMPHPQPPYPDDPLGYGSQPVDLTDDLADDQADLGYQPIEPVDDREYADAPDLAPPVVVPPVVIPAAPERVFPEGTVDLTGDMPLPLRSPAEDFARLNASLYGSAQAAGEPVPGTVEVERTVTQPNETVVMPVESVLDDHRAARARALGEVDPGADVVAAPAMYAPPSVYRLWPSIALFVFRLVLATVLSIRATQEWLHFTTTRTLWETSILPEPALLATVQIIVEYLIALMLLLGLASRVAGVLMMVVYIGVLSFVTWGAVNLFSLGVGFWGEFEVLMTACGLVLAGLGGGRVAIDATVHKARLEKKNARLA